MSRDSARRTQNFVLISTGAACVLLGGMLLSGRILEQPGHPDRVAPNTAVCFVLCGIALLCLSRVRRGRLAAVTGVLGAVAFALGTTSVFGYLAGYPTYVWGHWTQMAATSGAGFMLLGAGIIALAWRSGQDSPGAGRWWLAPAAGCAQLTMTL